ncbi:unnamed protein product [Protopolystoma xenopodis]|uniref:Tektin n=1 Tax=Protopolystoma xenopodis TaxID=117903 RepID=A0A448X3S1_9PLAT|nr:unnamed protein product [Protopolystoma xenopodis]
MRFTKDNIARSQRQRIASERIRNGIDNFLRSVASSIHGRFAIVNNALSTRIQEIRDAKDKLENSLKKTKREIFDIEEAIELINKSLADKLPPLRLAETRLEERVRRTNVENCQDTSMEA